MVEVYVVSAFSKENKGGNKAGVVLKCQGLSDEQKIEIARILGYSETAFVESSEAADYRIRYFTPTDEVPLCGHATIATFSLLKILNKLDGKVYTIETKAGLLKMEVSENGMVFMEQNRPEYLTVLDEDLFKECIPKEFINKHMVLQIVTTGLKDIILPINSMEHLEKMQPDMNELSKLSEKLDVVGVHAFVFSKNAEIDAVCRNFAPLYGIDEESATGTASCALASYLFKYWKKKSQYVFEQGYSMNSPSQIIVKLNYQDDVIEEIFVGGHGYLVEKRNLLAL